MGWLYCLPSGQKYAGSWSRSAAPRSSNADCVCCEQRLDKRITMSQAGRINSLSWGDTFFLYLEREGQPLNVACTCEFEGAISLRAFTKHVESRLNLIPRYKQRAVFPSFNLGLPTWELDPNFDIRNHVRQVVLKAGTDTGLKTVAANIISSTLNRERPLWDLTLVRGLTGNRTGLIIRLHHAVAASDPTVA